MTHFARERFLTVVMAAALLGGCAVGPDYRRPPVAEPATFRGQTVPAILVSGDHGAVRRWRLRESLRRTLARRPDLLAGRTSSPDEAAIQTELGQQPVAGVGGVSGHRTSVARPADTKS